MSEAKPFASLGAALLARKGGARPAMRSQLAALPALERPEGHHEDLGWNDMGELGEEHSADVLQMMPANEGASEVHRQQEAITVRLHQPVQAVREPARPRRSALDDGRRAAFTLRLDSDRHLRLRLACTVRNRSAQELVTEALDKLLTEMPDLDTLASQVKRK